MQFSAVQVYICFAFESVCECYKELLTQEKSYTSFIKKTTTIICRTARYECPISCR